MGCCRDDLVVRLVPDRSTALTSVVRDGPQRWCAGRHWCREWWRCPAHEPRTERTPARRCPKYRLASGRQQMVPPGLVSLEPLPHAHPGSSTPSRLTAPPRSPPPLSGAPAWWWALPAAGACPPDMRATPLLPWLPPPSKHQSARLATLGWSPAACRLRPGPACGVLPPWRGGGHSAAADSSRLAGCAQGVYPDTCPRRTAARTRVSRCP